MVDTTSARALTNAATKRIGYSEVLKVLFLDATRRVNTTESPKFDQVGDIAKTKRAVRLRDEYDRLGARRAEIERTLKLMGLAIPNYRGGPRFTVDHVQQTNAKTKWQHRQEQRLSEIARLKAAALIELVDLPRVEAKAYLLALQRTLAKV